MISRPPRQRLPRWVVGRLEQWQARLDELDIKHGGIAEDANGCALSFRDPDDIALELWAPRS